MTLPNWAICPAVLGWPSLKKAMNWTASSVGLMSTCVWPKNQGKNKVVQGVIRVKKNGACKPPVAGITLITKELAGLVLFLYGGSQH